MYFVIILRISSSERFGFYIRMLHYTAERDSLPSGYIMKLIKSTMMYTYWKDIWECFRRTTGSNMAYENIALHNINIIFQKSAYPHSSGNVLGQKTWLVAPYKFLSFFFDLANDYLQSFPGAIFMPLFSSCIR